MGRKYGAAAAERKGQRKGLGKMMNDSSPLLARCLEVKQTLLFEYLLKTPVEGFIDITQFAREAVEKSDIADGIVTIYCPHTTAGVTINENADPDVMTDMILGLNKAFPDRTEFLHAEGNSAAHLKTTATGSSVTVIIDKSRLLLGTWQSIFFCEFDGPRTRKFFVKVI